MSPDVRQRIVAGAEGIAELEQFGIAIGGEPARLSVVC
jgi:hypothetical protein